MNIRVTVENQTYSADLSSPIDLAIPLDFDGKQPNFFGVPKASARAYEAGDVIGDTSRGGPCNFDVVEFIPQCNGTHTECVGHIVNQSVNVSDLLPEVLIPATLVSVEPMSDPRSGDLVINAGCLQKGLDKSPSEFLKAVIIRTIPNHHEKMHHIYKEKEIPPYLIKDAFQFLIDRGTDHLLVDLPSVDRAYDEGRLTGHHLFWDIPQGSHDLENGKVSKRTITELIYVPDEAEDGQYFLNLQIPRFGVDAAPSRPIIYPADPE